MELVPLLIVLWRRRLLVALGFVAAVAVVVWLGSRPVAAGPGVAVTSVLVDTPGSEAVAVNPGGADTLMTRSVLLTHSMLRDEARAGIARSMGVSPNLVAVIDPALESPADATTLPLIAAKAASIHSQPFSLVLRLDPESPIISLEAYAPTPLEAARLVEAGQKQLNTLVPTATGPTYQRFTIRPITELKALEIASSHGRILAVAAAAVLFGGWCVFLIVATRLLRMVRRQSGRRRLAQAPAATS